MENEEEIRGSKGRERWGRRRRGGVECMGMTEGKVGVYVCVCACVCGGWGWLLR